MQNMTFMAFFKRQLALPLMVFSVFVAINAFADIDILLASTLFHLQGGGDHWPLRTAWITESVLHTGGRNLVILMAAIVLLSLVASFFSQRFKSIRRGLVYLFLSALATVMLVRIGKNVTHMFCPWDLRLFGGTHLYVPLFGRAPTGAEVGQCFPAGHSSGGYAWVALYYFFLLYWPQKAKLGLAFGLSLGFVFGVGQQLRGAHFLSHDLWSVTIAWTLASLLFYVMFVRTSATQKTITIGPDSASVVAG